MNRIAQLSEEPITAVGDLVESAKTVSPSTATEAESHAFFAPLHYERNYAYPLVVWLHGPQDSEDQLRRIMPLVSMRNYVAVAPRGTLAADVETGQGGYHWQPSADHIELAEQRVFECLELAQQRFHIDSSRIFLAGYAEGGTMAYRIALSHPRHFAGVLSLGGAFPTGDRPLRNVNQSRRLPLLLAAGRDSTIYSEAMVCRDLRLLHAAGMTVTLRLYPCGDELSSGMLADIDRWMMEQVCPSGSACRNATGRQTDQSC